MNKPVNKVKASLALKLILVSCLITGSYGYLIGYHVASKTIKYECYKQTMNHNPSMLHAIPCPMEDTKVKRD